MVDWIKCEDKLPEDRKFVLCWCNDDSFGIGHYEENLGGRYEGQSGWVIANQINNKVIAWAEFNMYR